MIELSIVLKTIIIFFLTLTLSPIIYSFSLKVLNNKSNFHLVNLTPYRKRLKTFSRGILTKKEILSFWINWLEMTLLIFCISLFPMLDGFYFQEELIKTTIVESDKSLGILCIVLFFLPLLDLFKKLFIQSDNDLVSIESNLVNIYSIGILTLVTLFGFILSYKTLSLEIILQYQTGLSSSFIPSWVIFNNPFLALSFILLIGLQMRGRDRWLRNTASFFSLESIKMFTFSYVFTSLFLGGGKLFGLFEEIVESLPFLEFLIQLMSLMIKLIPTFLFFTFLSSMISRVKSSVWQYLVFKVTLPIGILSIVKMIF